MLTGLRHDQHANLQADKDGKIIGLSIPTDLPDTVGLAQARKEIGELVKAGMDPGEALIQVREKFYNDLGALAIRAQLHDTMGHIVLDPANYILPMLSPVEALQARRVLALTKRIPVDELVEAEKVARAAGNLEGAERIAQTLAKVNSGELKPLTSFDNFAIMATSGDPFKAVEDLSVLEKVVRKKSITPSATGCTSRSRSR